MLESGWMLALSGCLVGAIIGFAARKSHFCTMAALERHWYADDDRPLRAWALAAFTALIATQLLAAAGLAGIDQSFYITEPLPLAGAIVGGLMFGVGMALVGTCGFGALVRLGGGNLRALVVLTGLGLAALAAQRGVTAHIRTVLLDPWSVDLSALGGQSAGTLVSRATGLDVTLPLALLIGAAGLWWVFRSASFRADRNRAIAGVIIGLCIAAGWVITSAFAAHALHPVQVEAGSFVMPVGETILQIITIGAEIAITEKALTPCPMVQPSAKTPPVPIRKAPSKWRLSSRASSQASQRMSSERKAEIAAPMNTPTTMPMP